MREIPSYSFGTISVLVLSITSYAQLFDNKNDGENKTKNNYGIISESF